MSGGTPLIDKLLAPASAQRSDLVPLKGQLAIYAADAVTDLEAIANDTRLPSRAAVERQLGVDPGQLAPAGGARPPAAVADGASLSAAARVISELLGTTPAKGDAVRGSAPLWPATAATAAPEPQQLAAALARSVAGSGLFYESHLLQFFSGQRSLAQLLQEPQAKLTLPSAAADLAASAAPGLGHVTASIAADAIPLVRQQLELLALSQFRWSGEAWPDAAMEWEMTEQGQRRQGGRERNLGSNPEQTPRSWSTRLSMTLPRLGSIELRLSLAGDSWRAELAAAEAATLSSMRADGEQLRQRFSAAGLHLSDLQVVQLPQATAEEQSDKKNDSKHK
ncbi:flagellar hook-length control protein FliK [Collimonas silvisoli]|uniref:flagellar hook-length control protein FliK n=1 Tax=Collimonas silvisoli TaxID=2825884 RepID=UPI001B8B6587|nr:flagellar hook-length control protein FliK [Collimonas silvisoli]